MSKNLHPRNRNLAPYDLQALTKCLPELAAYIRDKPGGGKTLDFSHPGAVKRLNQALMDHHYGISSWEFPNDNLCPAIPGRADALHTIADLISEENRGHIPKGPQIVGLDIGTGASLVDPLIGTVEYGWSFIGTDVAPASISSAQRILAANPHAARHITCRLQSHSTSIFKNIIQAGEFIDFTLCNPPFHDSLEAAQAAARRKLRHIEKRKPQGNLTLNFAGIEAELIYPGGEVAFILNMIEESIQWSRQVFWFTSLVAQADHVPSLLAALQQAGATKIEELPLATGNKSSRILAWTFLDTKARKIWQEARWQRRSSKLK